LKVKRMRFVWHLSCRFSPLPWKLLFLISVMFAAVTPILYLFSC
jgi:hypothetical protein